jgi:hypothetical protein
MAMLPGGAVADFFRSLGRSATSSSLLILLPLGRCSSFGKGTLIVGVVGDSGATSCLEPGLSSLSDREEEHDDDIMNVSSTERRLLISVMGRFAKFAEGPDAAGTS